MKPRKCGRYRSQRIRLALGLCPDGQSILCTVTVHVLRFLVPDVGASRHTKRMKPALGPIDWDRKRGHGYREAERIVLVYEKPEREITALASQRQVHSLSQVCG